MIVGFYFERFFMNMYLPIALIVVSNIFYHICSKSTPQNINPFAALTVTYLVGAVLSLGLFFVFSPDKNLLGHYKQINWTTIILGLAIVGLEAGSIYMYKAGWDISTGQLVYSSILAICLIAVGYFLYNETITLTKLAGIAICVFGLFLINK